MATLKVKRATSAGASLNYGELAIGNDELYFGDSENLPVQLEKVQPINTVFINTTTTDVYYRIATIPINSQYKQCIFRLKAYTATGTTTESTIIINLAYYSGNYTSQYSGIIANTSHSYNSGTTAENGWVLYYIRLSFDATYGYIDVYKYKTTPITVESQPLTNNDWTWLNETTTTSVSAGAYRATTVQLAYGLYGNNIYANNSGTSGYSNYGVLLGSTISNNTNKAGQWISIGYIRFDYNSSYLQGRAINVALDLKEIDSQTGTTIGDKITIHIQATLGYHASSTAFSTLIPNMNLEIEGQTTLSTSDLAMVITSSSTSYKYIYVYLKLKGSNTVYDILPRNRYGWSYTTSYGKTTSYCTFYATTDAATISPLPTPVLGSITYANWRSETIDVAKVNSLYIYNEDSLSYFRISGGSEIPNGSLDIDTEGSDISFNLGGNLTLANNFSTSGNFPLTLTTSATTNATIPSGTITLMDLGTAQTITGVKTFTGNINANGGIDVDDVFVVADGGALTTSQLITSTNATAGTSTTGAIKVTGGIGQTGAYTNYFEGATTINDNLTVNGQISFNDSSRYWLATSSNWGLYWDTTDNRLEFHGAGVDRAGIGLDNGLITTAGGLTLTGGIINHTSTDSYDKIRVYSSSEYAIGFKSAQTYGYIEDWAMTFTMNNEADRGFLFRDANDTAADGAMSLTTDGKMKVKTLIESKEINMVDSSDILKTTMKYDSTSKSIKFIFV